jgi:hypothetical protein
MWLSECLCQRSPLCCMVHPPYHFVHAVINGRLALPAYRLCGQASVVICHLRVKVLKCASGSHHEHLHVHVRQTRRD